MAFKLDYFEGLVSSINKKYGYKFSVSTEHDQVQLIGSKGRIFGTSNPAIFESALKSLKKEGTISHYLFEERKDYKAFIDQKIKEGKNPKQAHKEYFESII